MIGAQELFVCASDLSSDDDVSKAEAVLNCKLPVGYGEFVRILGSGVWAQAEIAAPSSLYAVDQSVGEMKGLIPLAENVDGSGNYVAFNCLDQKLYFCSHDPLGFSLVANSFEEFIETIAEKWQRDTRSGTRLFYESLPDFKEVIPPQQEQKGSWWKFW
ncbi:MAG: SMI1/KNR4 family protein [Candidatus Melainabacteria bacterium]|nr:SMI1/KNR4 family protein [Candidatus Melainabacteria bacterium]